MDKPEKNRWTFEMSVKSIAMIVIGALINIGGFYVASELKLPVWLDSIGTFLNAIILGPIAGALTGLVMNLLVEIYSPGHIWFALVSIAGGLAVGRFFPRERKIESFSVIATALFAGFVMTIVATPLNMYFNSGYTGNAWGDALVTMMSEYISFKTVCCLAGELLVEMPDKALSIGITMLIIYMGRKLRRDKATDSDDTVTEGKMRPAADNRASKGKRTPADGMKAWIGIAIMLSFIIQGVGTVKAATDDDKKDFESGTSYTVYGVDNGLPSAEINAVAQTREGYLWAGGYSGLFRYNGSFFEMMELDDRINNVMELFVDSEGMLWIGTNDSGAFRYDPASRVINAYTTAEGLASDSIRSISEDGEGSIYIGTAAELCRLGRDGRISIIRDSDINCVYSLKSTPDKHMLGVTHDGVLFVADGDEIRFKERSGQQGVSFAVAAVRDDGRLLIGTTAGVFFYYVYDDGSLKQDRQINADFFSSANCITPSPDKKGFFATGSKGVAYIDDKGIVTELSRDGFDTAVEDVTVDYQGNVWFASSKQGVMKLSDNPFLSISKKAGIESGVVNAILLDGSLMYVGMDTGLKLIDTVTDSPVNNELTNALDGYRVRAFLKDSTGCIWISTYSSAGLVRVMPGEKDIELSAFSEDLKGNWIRFCMELSDSTVMVVTTDGLYFVKDGKVSQSMSAESGFSVPQILTAVETEDGSIMCGSDGEGVYFIKNGEVTGHIGKEQGLASLVVLKIVPAGGGYIFVTSNGLFFRESNGQVRRLKEFPYNNNYDVEIMDDGKAWVTSSAGIYVVETAKLIADEEFSYELLNRNRGFDTTLTANAWNLKNGDDYYLCCTDGVRLINTKTYDDMKDDFNIVLANVITDDEDILPENGVYNLPSGKGRTVIRPAVLNYSTSDLMLKLELEGLKDSEIRTHQTELSSLQFPNLSYGDYELKISVIDELSGEIKKTASFKLHKDAELYEHLYYKLYLLFVGGMLVAFLAWMVAKMSNMAVINRQYDQIREAKEEAELANQAKSRFLANMSHEIRTPINTVLGMDEMILRESSEPGIRGYAEDIYTAGNTLLSLINDILDSSKIESGRMEIVPVEYELKTMIRDLVNMIKKRALDKDLILEPMIDESLPSVLYGDDVRIKQVLTNMLTNAVKYTHEGTVWLKMSGSREGDELVLHCEVEDTGMGIKKEDLPKLFEAFQRIEEGRNRNIEGTGLGMNITLQLLEMMGSRLEVESEYGKGSRFWFDIRQRIVRDTPIGDPFTKEFTEGEGYSYNGSFIAPDASVLVVDDNEMNLKVFRSLLKPLRMNICEASGGMEALKKADENTFDIVFLDHMMPGMDGVETLHEMRKLNRYDSIPIYALTANAISGAREYYLQEGFSGFISKPVVSAKLEQAIREALPQEKLLPYEEEAAGDSSPLDQSKQDEEKSRVLESLPDVDGLDWEYAWLHLPYEDVLELTVRTFRDTVDSQADKLDEMYKAVKSAIDEDSRQEALKDYRILVHSMKGSSAMLGIVPLAGMAKVLEYAAKNGDVERIEKMHGTFLVEWRSYKDKLKGVYEDKHHTEEHGSKGRADSDMIKAMLDLTEQAMEDFDVDAMDEMSDKLISYSYEPEIEELVEELIGAVKDLNQDEVIKLANQIRFVIG